ncbi:MAG: F0F1 ATP synthase subunit B [Phycisphaerales bacterium]|jgi:F-type H+-transporting ATPase subunit b
MSIKHSLQSCLLLLAASFGLLFTTPMAAAQEHTAAKVESAIKSAATEGEHAANHALENAGEHDDGAHSGIVPSVEEGIVPAIVALVVFALVLAISAKMVWPKIATGLLDRENKIRSEIEGAEMARQQAKDALEQYQKSLADARAEANKMLESTRAQQAALAADLRASAEKDLAEMRERAKKDIESAKRAAVAELYEHASGLGAMIASKILKREVNAGDTNGLVEESLRQLQTSKN